MKLIRNFIKIFLISLMSVIKMRFFATILTIDKAMRALFMTKFLSAKFPTIFDQFHKNSIQNSIFRRIHLKNHCLQSIFKWGVTDMISFYFFYSIRLFIESIWPVSFWQIEGKEGGVNKWICEWMTQFESIFSHNVYLFLSLQMHM